MVMNKIGDFISVLLPLHNDGDILSGFLDDLFPVLEEHYENYEVILVDDGSTDNTRQVIDENLRRFEGLRLLRLARHYGLEMAVGAGFDSVVGDIVVTMQVGQDPVDRLVDMVRRVRESQTVVFGRLAAKEYGILERLGRLVFHWACRWLGGFNLPKRTTAFLGLNRTVLNTLVGINDRYRYLKTFAENFGREAEYLEYKRHLRRGWAPRRGLFASMQLAASVVVSFSIRPLRIINLVCLLATGFYLMYMAYILVIYFIKEKVAEGWVTLSMQNAVAFFVVSLVLLVIGEYLGRVLEESSARPRTMVIDDRASSVLIPGQHERKNVVEDAGDSGEKK